MAGSLRNSVLTPSGKNPNLQKEGKSTEPRFQLTYSPGAFPKLFIDNLQLVAGSQVGDFDLSLIFLKLRMLQFDRCKL